MTVEPGVYRHYKGPLYRVLFIAHDSTNGPDEGRELVIYLSMNTGRMNARTVKEFQEPIGIVAPVPRFQRVY